MNKRKIVMAMALLLIVLVGCGKQNDIDETIQTTAEHVAESSIETTAMQESVPGIEDSEFDDIEPAVEQAKTEAAELVETKPSEIKPAETKPAETKPAETKPTETKPAETKPAETKPSETTPPTKPAQPEVKPQTEYERFQNMSAAEQQSHMESFDSMDDFFNWYNDAKTEHEAANPPIDVGNGSIDMGELME